VGYLGNAGRVGFVASPVHKVGEVTRPSHRITRESERIVITTESHAYAVELLSTNFGVMNTIRTTTESGALWKAENLGYLLGRQNRQGDTVAVIVTKRWTGSEWEVMTETEW
jgi:hypothetical protein